MRRFNITAGAASCPSAEGITEDNYYFNGFYLDKTQIEYPSMVNSAVQNELDLFAICSGDSDEGHIASYYAMEYLDRYSGSLYCEDNPDWQLFFSNYLENTNRFLRREAERTDTEFLLKTTVLGIDDKYLYGAGAGDCAAFLLHSGVISELTAKADKSVIIGNSEKVTGAFSIEKAELSVGDSILLLDPEAAALLSIERIQQLMEKEGDINEKLREIVKAAIDAGAKKSISAVLICVEKAAIHSFLAGKGGARLIAGVAVLLLAAAAALAYLLLRP